MFVRYRSLSSLSTQSLGVRLAQVPVGEWKGGRATTLWRRNDGRGCGAHSVLFRGDFGVDFPHFLSPVHRRDGEGGERQRADADTRIDQGNARARRTVERHGRDGADADSNSLFFRVKNGQVENISPLLQEPNLRQFFGLVGTVRRLQWMTR